jgi:alpha-glucoside transport system permease protein
MIGLVYAVLIDKAKIGSRALIFLRGVSLVGASLIWKFVYDYEATENSRSAWPTRS